MNTKKTTATLTIFVIVTAVALVTANGLNTQVFALKGATVKTTSSKTLTSTRATSPFAKFISCVKTTNRVLTLEYVNSCYDRGYTGRSGISKTAESSSGLPANAASSLIPIVGLPTTNPSTSPDLGHASHHVATHAHHSGTQSPL
jgi:hypothetical protein